jgi:hypothetical protein
MVGRHSRSALRHRPVPMGPWLLAPRISAPNPRVVAPAELAAGVNARRPIATEGSLTAVECYREMFGRFRSDIS